MKKLLSILLALVLMLSLVSCGGSDDANKVKDEEVKKTDKELVEETAVAFMDALVDLDFEEVKEYVTNKEEISEAVKGYDIASVKAEFMTQLPEEIAAYTKPVETFFDFVVAKAKSSFDYKIKEIVKEEKDKYIVKIDFTEPDMESVDLESVMAELMTEEGVQNLLLEMLEAGTISEETSEEELTELVITEVFNIATEALNEVEFATSTEEIEIVVVKDGDAWLVDSETSDLD